eukprot:388673-Pyramimonas_sp.AAC.1
MQRLLQDASRFDASAASPPKDQALCGGPFAVEDNAFKGASVKNFLVGALQIGRGGVDCSEDAAQPIAKDMVATSDKLLTFGDARVDIGAPGFDLA